MELTDREYEVVTNLWGDDTPRDLRAIESEQLVAMHHRVSNAVHASFQDADHDALGILLPLERKIVTVLHERI